MFQSRVILSMSHAIAGQVEGYQKQIEEFQKQMSRLQENDCVGHESLITELQQVRAIQEMQNQKHCGTFELRSRVYFFKVSF